MSSVSLTPSAWLGAVRTQAPRKLLPHWLAPLVQCSPGGPQILHLTVNSYGPGPVAQLVRASSRYTKVAGSIPGQSTYKKQPMNAYVEQQVNVSLSLSLNINNKINKIKMNKKPKNKQ